jgi:hypothetical protein
MALLSGAEIEKLKEQGIYVREKCDHCGKPILSSVSYIPKGSKEVWCLQCGKGSNVVEANLTEEMNMKKAAKEKKAAPKEKVEKILGHFRKGTALGDMAEMLQDEKPHKLSTLLVGIQKKHKLEDGWRGFGTLRTVGEKKGTFGIVVDKEDDRIQLKFGKATSEFSPNEEKKKLSAKSSKPALQDKEPVTSKTQNATARLVRRTLKSGKNWTKNKLVEHMHKEHGIEQKRTEMAITDELKNGGLTVEDGILSLA